jgi:hypothetical protein
MAARRHGGHAPGDVVDGTVLGTERGEFLMTYDAAAILYARLGELLASKPD